MRHQDDAWGAELMRARTRGVGSFLDFFWGIPTVPEFPKRCPACDEEAALIVRRDDTALCRNEQCEWSLVEGVNTADIVALWLSEQPGYESVREWARQ